MTTLSNSYHERFTTFISDHNADTEGNFLSYLGQLESNQLKSLLFDILFNRVKQDLIPNVSIGLSNLSYFAIKFDKLRKNTQSKIVEALLIIGKENISLERDSSYFILDRLIELSRLMEWGLPSKFLIEKIILNTAFNIELRYNAAIALAQYADKAATEFWKNQSGDAISFYGFLSFPRFLYFSESDSIKAFASLSCFKKTNYIHKEDLQIPLEDFFLSIKDDEQLLKIILSSFENIDPWLRTFIDEHIFIDQDLMHLKQVINPPMHLSASHRYPLSTKKKENGVTSVLSLEDTTTSITNLKNYINKKLHYNRVLLALENTSFQSQLLNQRELFAKYFYNYKNTTTEFIVKDSKLKPYIEFMHYGYKAFKQSRFSDAVNYYNRALHNVYSVPVFFNDHLNIYTWILHDLGDVYFALNQLQKAQEIFVDCYNVTRTDNKIDESFYLVLQMKIFGIASYNPRLNVDWEYNLVTYIKYLEKLRIDTEQKSFNVHALLGEAYYYLCNGYFRTEELENFFYSYEQSLRIVRENGDVITSLKLQILSAVLHQDYGLLEDIKELVSAMSEYQKEDPFITTFLGSFEEYDSSKRQMLHTIKEVFGHHNIDHAPVVHIGGF